MIDKRKKAIICTSFANGKKHDFKLFKESKVRWIKSISGLTDTGYTGIKKLQSNTKLPQKRRKGKFLTRKAKERKSNNCFRTSVE